jgi:hypothetical protein
MPRLVRYLIKEKYWNYAEVSSQITEPGRGRFLRVGAFRRHLKLPTHSHFSLAPMRNFTNHCLLLRLDRFNSPMLDIIFNISNIFQNIYLNHPKLAEVTIFQHKNGTTTGDTTLN